MDKALNFLVVSKTVYFIPFALMTFHLKTLAKSVVNEINMMILSVIVKVRSEMRVFVFYKYHRANFRDH